MGRPRWNILLQKRTAEKQKLCSKRSREDGSINDLSTQRRNVFFELDGKIKTLNEMGTVPSCAIVKAKLFCPEIAGLFCRIAGLFCHDSRANLSLKPVCFGIAIS